MHNLKTIFKINDILIPMIVQCANNYSLSNRNDCFTEILVKIGKLVLVLLLLPPCTEDIAKPAATKQ